MVDVDEERLSPVLVLVVLREERGPSPLAPVETVVPLFEARHLGCLGGERRGEHQDLVARRHTDVPIPAVERLGPDERRRLGRTPVEVARARRHARDRDTIRQRKLRDRLHFSSGAVPELYVVGEVRVGGHVRVRFVDRGHEDELAVRRGFDVGDDRGIAQRRHRARVRVERNDLGAQLFSPLHGWIRNDSGITIVVAKLHRAGISRVFLMLRQTVRRRPMIKSLVDEAETLLDRCDAHTLSGTHDAAAARSMPIIGIVHIAPGLFAKASWFTNDASFARLLSVVKVHEDGALQPQVAALYRSLTQEWATDEPKVATFGALLPGIVMHVFPAGIEGLEATLVFEHVRLRRSLREAFAEFSITSREAQVIRLLMSGHSVREAATILSIAESTTHDHIKSVLTKTHARNRAQMISILLGYEGVQVRPPSAQTAEAADGNRLG